MRADAKKNYEHILAVATEVVAIDGADASLREIARKADVGLGTLYRHFPTREALLETLLRASFDELTAKAREVEAAGGKLVSVPIEPGYSTTRILEKIRATSSDSSAANTSNPNPLSRTSD